MAFFTGAATVLGAIFKPLGDMGKQWVVNRGAKQERKDAIRQTIADANLARAQAYAKGDTDADTAAVENMKYSWKDEYLTIVFTLPIILGFLPVDGINEIIKQGWKNLDQAPDWYTWVILGIVVSTFGLRAMAARKLFGGKD